jgi:hypothetical protein
MAVVDDDARIRPTHDEPDPGVAESPLDPALEEDQPSSGWNLSEG